jgi:hypothetical protein
MDRILSIVQEIEDGSCFGRCARRITIALGSTIPSNEEQVRQLRSIAYDGIVQQ